MSLSVSAKDPNVLGFTPQCTALHCMHMPGCLIQDMPSFSFSLESSSSIRDPGRHSHCASEPCRSPGTLGSDLAAAFPHVCECLGKVLPQGSQHLTCSIPAPGLIRRSHLVPLSLLPRVDRFGEFSFVVHDSYFQTYWWLYKQQPEV